jgi:hypothetical protein
MKRTATSGALTAALLTLGAPAAMAAAGFDGGMTGSYATGTVSITSDTTRVYGRVYDTRADGKCAKLRGNWDYILAPDAGFDVAEACGNGTSRYGDESRSTRGGGSLRDFEVRVYTGGDHVVVWQGDNNDA